MNRTSYLSLFVVAAATGVLLAGNAQSQLGVKGQVNLQPTTPGTSQSGHVNISGTMQAGQHVGGGAGLTNLNASNISNGSLADSRLTTNVALLNGISQVFSTGKTFSATASFTNLTTPFIISSSNLVANLNADRLDGQHGAFYQDAANLTGSILDARLSTNVALLASNQTFTGQKTFSQFPSFTNASVPFSVTSSNMVGNLNAQLLAGNGSAFYTNASNISFGTLADARLTSNVATLSGSQTFSGQKTFSSNPRITPGAQSGHVLTSDASGNASWQAPSGVPVGSLILLHTDVPPPGYEYLNTQMFPGTVMESYGTFPEGFGSWCIGGAQGKVYIYGWNIATSPYSSELYVYDINSNTTTLLNSSFPDINYQRPLVVEGNFLYALSRVNEKLGVVQYNISANSWTILPASPIDWENSYATALGVANGDPLLFGGVEGIYSTASKKTWRLQGGNWNQVGDQSIGRIRPPSVIQQFNQPFLFGGKSNMIENFVPAANTWNPHPMVWLPESFGEDTIAVNVGPTTDDIVVMSPTAGYKLSGGPNGTWERVQSLPGETTGAYGWNGKVYLSSLKRFTPSPGLYLHRKL